MIGASRSGFVIAGELRLIPKKVRLAYVRLQRVHSLMPRAARLPYPDRWPVAEMTVTGWGAPVAAGATHSLDLSGYWV
jgi:hypothetical protein